MKNLPNVKKIRVAIVDYGMGNVFNVQRACSFVGMDSQVTSDKTDILRADAIILPGVGAFGDAIEALKKNDLISPLHDYVAAGKILLGICLGMQLLMSKSYEFGEHKGLNIIPGEVLRFKQTDNPSCDTFKVPEVGWNNIYSLKNSSRDDPWQDSMLEGIINNEFMYFVHSYYVIPDNSSFSISMTRYGNKEFCSSLQNHNIFACQFHPEKSGPEGLKIYRNLRLKAESQKKVC